MDLYLEGSKGGEDKAHTPVEAPNNLLSVAYAKVLLAVAEGELSGVPTGKDIFLNGTPLLAADGTPNFGGVTWDWRPGTVDQTYIQGMPSVSSETSVGVELTNTTPYVRQITKTSLSAVRVTLAWPALMKQESNGDTNGVTIDYAIDVATNGGAYVLYKQYQVSGKTNTDYERTHRVDLPKGATNWTLRVRRITPNSESSLIQDTMNIKSYAEVVDAKQKYPNTALLFVQFDSRLFGGGSIPKISVKVKGRLVRVPTNYEPTTRTYSGVWDGTFKWAYTNNPAWIFFDIVTQNRFGLGNRVNLNQVDKWELYEVAQYCDVLVDDGTGAGTKEPRHTCNIYIQSQEDAWTVLRDICSIFNGMTYWDGNAFVARADKQEPLDNIPLFGRSNVIGDFNYQTTDERTIFTSALVSYDEPTDHYGTQVEAVWEKSQILRWGGDRQTTLAAVGCTSRGEAQRKGKYTLITNMFNRSVTFKTGLQGLDPKVRPGAIIGVADPLIAGKEFTGRMTAATLKVVTLDRVTEAKAGDKLYITRKDGSQEARTVQAAAGKVITLTTNYSEIALPNSVWYLEAEDLKSQLFKIVKLKFDGAACEVSGIEYNDSKFGAVDNGARLEPRPISKTPPQAQKPPSAVYVTSRTYTEQMMAVTAMTVTWPKTENAVLYEGQWRVGQGDWVSAGTTGATQFEIKGIYSGQYVARVRAINALDIKSGWTLSEATQLNGKVGSPPSLASLTVDPLVFGMRLKWTFAPNSEDTARTEIMYSPTASFASATKLGDFAYPQVTHDINGLKAGQQFFFWARIVDRTGNVGPYFPLTTQNGVMGLSSTDFNEYEEYFKDQISESALGQQLAERIDLIDGPATMVGSVNERVKTVSDQVTQVNTDLSEQLSDTNILIGQTNDALDATNAQIVVDKAATQAQIDATNAQIVVVKNDLQGQVDATNQAVVDVTNDLQGQIDAIQDLADSIDYIPTNTYTTGQSVLGTDKRLYQAKQNVPINTPPPNTTYWTDIGQVVSSADGLAARVSTVETTVTNQDGRITANTSAITGLTSSLAGKADASALTSLTTRVTTAEGTIASQGTAITGLTSTVAGKADTTALNSLTTRVTTAEGLITSQGNAITSLTSTVAGKADTTAVTALTTRVTAAEGNITSQGNSITTLTATLGNIGGNGTNLLPAEYCVYNTTAPTWTLGSGVTVTTSLETETFSGSAMKVVNTTNAVGNAVYLTPATTYAGLNMAMKNQKYIVSFYAKADVDGHLISSFLRTMKQDGTVSNSNGGQVALTTTWARYSAVLDVSVGATFPGDKMALVIQPNRSGVTGRTVYLDKIMIEGQIGTSVAPSPFVIGNSNSQNTANASAISSLTARVTAAEGTITSQSTSITTLTNNLTTTNSNVTAAQSAADAANTLAGGKGKVFYGTSAPAVGEQLSQNLWIDTNGGANTPKRWNGSAWVAVTDKVATDAAAAAANALSVAQTKADASAVTALTTRVTNAEGTITSQGNSITSLNNSLTTTNGNVTAAAAAAQAASDLAGGKGEVIYSASAPAVAKQLSQNLWIDITGGANTPKRWNGSAWVAVTDKIATDAAAAAASALSLVATKADSSALTALSNTVTQQGNTLTAQGNSITSINATIGSMSGNGTNLLNDVYSWLTSTTPPTVALSTATSFTGVAVTGSASGFGYRYVRPNVASPWFMFCPTNNTAGWNIPLVPGKYLMSFYASTDTQGVTDGLVIRAAMWDGSSRSPTDFTLTTTRTRYTALITITNSNTYGFTLFFPVGVSGNVTIIDSPMIEKQVGTGLEPSPFTPGNSALSVTTNATAVSSLTARVTTAEGTIVSQGNAITGLTSTVAGKADTSALNSLTTRVTTAEGLITSQGNAITSLTSTVAGKADTSAVNALTTRVTAAEGTITAHTNSITSLSASVNNATQENVLLNPDWNASGALLTESNSTFITEYFDRAQGPAGSPADRLLCRTRVGSTTGWGGFALNSRNGTIYTPAIAGEVINLEVQMFCENAVANAGKICITPWDSVNGSIVGNVRILGYDAVVGGWQKLSTQYTLPAGTASFSIYVTPEGVSPVGFKMWLANLKVTRQTVDGSVSAKATSALDARVTTVEGTVTSQATSITNLNSVVSGIGGNGSNLVPAEYSVFNAIKPEIIYGGSIATTAVDVGAMNGYALKVTTNSTTTSATIYTAVADTYAAYNMASKQGKYILSYYAKTETEGHTIALFLRGRNSADVAVSSSGASQDALTTTWTRYSQVVDLTGVTYADKDKMTIGIQVNRSGVTGRVFYIDRIMLEPLVGTNTTPSTFSIGNSAAKLDALSSATTALTTRVTTAEGNITTQASNLTNLASSIGGAGTNLLNDVYSWITSTTLPATNGNTATITGVAVPEATSGFGYKFVSTGTSTGGYAMLCPTNTAAGWNIPMEAGTYLVSFWASSPTVGATLRNRLYSSTTSAYSATTPLTTTRTRYTLSVVQSVPATQAVLFYFNMSGVSGTEVIVDSVMVEKRIGTTDIASPFTPGTSAQSATANATATAALTTRVTAAEGTITSQGSSITTLTNSLTTTNGNVTAAQTALNALTTRVTTAEGTITSQGNSITSLTASVGGVVQENYVLDPTYNVGKEAVSNSSQMTIVPQTDVSVPAGSSVPRLAKWDVPTSTGNTYVGWQCAIPQRSPATALTASMAPGEVYEVSCDFYMDAAGGARQHGIWFQFYDAANASIGHNWVTGAISTTNGQWKTLSGTITVPATAVRGRPTFRASAGNATPIWIANMRWTKQNPIDAATASALATLDATVTQQGTTITSQGSAVTALQSTVGAIGGSGTNLIPAEYCSFTSVLPTFYKLGTMNVVAEADTSAYSGYLMKATTTVSATGYIYLSSGIADYNVMVSPSKKYIVSFWAKGSANHNVGVRVRFPNNAAGVTETQIATIAVTTTMARYSAVVTMPATLVDRAEIVLFTQNTAAVGDTWFDGFMLEAQIGTATEASNFVPGTSTRQASATATAISSLDTRITSTEGIVSAQATKLDGVYLQVNPAMSGDSSGFAGDDSATVGVWTEQTARIDDDIAIGKRVDNVMAQVDDALAVIQSEAIARADADSALATTIDRVQVSANNANAAVQTVSQAQVTADGKASAMWSVKLQVNQWGQYAVAGVGLGLENTGAGLQSYFLVNANNFYISNGVNANVAVPFAVVGGQTFISSAVIQDASITMLKIGDNLQSDNYVAGVTGWRMLKSGVFEINGYIAGQGRMTMTNRSLRVYDGNGVKRVQLGDLSE